MKDTETGLSYRKIFLFWYPLAITWIMMAVEQPFLNAIIARLSLPKYNLAAFGVAFSFAVFIESPIIMLMSASTALVKSRDEYLKMLRFTQFLNSLITLVMIVLVIPAVFYFLTETIIGLDRRIAELTHGALIILIPWPAAIGFRRFFQGILIKHNQTRKVALGTAVRLGSMVTTGLLLYFLGAKGACLGATALTLGVVNESVATWLMARKTIINIKRSDPPVRKGKALTYGFVTRFYYPLALTSMLSLGVHPLVTFFLGQSYRAIESLAILPVINSLVFLFRSIGLSYQEVAIALFRKKARDYQLLRNFALFLALGLGSLLALIVFTPLSRIWFFNISGLSLELANLARFPAQILVLLPCLTVWLSFQRSILVLSKKTTPITIATAIEVTLIIIVLFVAITRLNLVGAVAAASAFIIGRISANLFLTPVIGSNKKSILAPSFSKLKTV